MKEHVPVDFFGRRIQPKIDPAKQAEKKANEIIISDVWFKFKEGYNNAVRKNIRMKDLLWKMTNMVLAKYMDLNALF